MSAPAIILVEPQLPENIGMGARAMANFGLAELRLVAPREGWPHPGAVAAAAGADRVLTEARVFPDLREAVGDLHLVLATTARSRGQMKRVVGPAEGLGAARAAMAAGQRVGILFGRERTGLENDDIALADLAMTFPVDPAFASLNLAQAVLLVGYEWARGGAEAASTPAPMPARRATLLSFLDDLEERLAAAGHFPPDKRPVMSRNLRDIFLRVAPGEQDVRTLRGIVRSLAEAHPPQKT